MRKRRAKKRYLQPDPQFNDPLVTRFVNNLMLDGKKNVAYSIFYDSLEIVGKKTKSNGYETWKKALENIMPGVEVKSRRIGGATFQIPIEIRPDRKIALAMKWLITFSRSKSGRSMADNLANEIEAASKNEGPAIKKREDMHRMADANKAFSHFRV